MYITEFEDDLESETGSRYSLANISRTSSVSIHCRYSLANISRTSSVSIHCLNFGFSDYLKMMVLKLCTFMQFLEHCLGDACIRSEILSFSPSWNEFTLIGITWKSGHP